MGTVCRENFTFSMFPNCYFIEIFCQHLDDLPIIPLVIYRPYKLDIVIYLIRKHDVLLFFYFPRLVRIVLNSYVSILEA